MIYSMILLILTGMLDWEHCSNKTIYHLQKMLLWRYPKQNDRFFIRVDFFLLYRLCLFQKNDKGNLYMISYISCTFTTNELEVCTIYREPIGIVSSLKICELNIVGSDHFIGLLNDQEPILNCFNNRRNLSPFSYMH